ncbi:SDR family oxidoreductase [Aspergillus undulatus]|uniref:SDR family oxidoreductase n=1 Tax=Aspergillus undulatus TaxID=1810928 RepID=UPI003CCDA978
MMDIKFVLVTGATGFIGAHIVDALLARGIRVRGATRSIAKGEGMMKARPQYREQLEFVRIDDFEKPGGLVEAVQGVDGIIHTASPFTYDTTNNEKELVRPAINGIEAVLEAAAASKTSTVRRIVLTSSFASVIDINRKAPPYFTYSASDWNPLSYAESIDPATNAVVAYRGSKKFAELAAWKFIEDKKPPFDLVTLCPPMTFGPIVHPIASVETLNESNATLWKVAAGSNLPTARVPFWIDVRDLAQAHLGALTVPDAGGKRYTPASPERFSYALAAEIIRDEFESLREGVSGEVQPVDESHGLDGRSSGRELGFGYRAFRETVCDLVEQVLALNSKQTRALGGPFRRDLDTCNLRGSMV